MTGGTKTGKIYEEESNSIAFENESSVGGGIKAGGKLKERRTGRKRRTQMKESQATVSAFTTPQRIN